MAFVLPDFNLNVAIYTGPWLTKVLRVPTLGNLAFSRRMALEVVDHFDAGAGVNSFQPLLLLPPLTDVRSGVQAGVPDVIEIPTGSGRWYGVTGVEDIGKGFANEHRVAGVTQISAKVDAVHYAGLVWPTPMT